MTVIVWDGQTLATDRAASVGNAQWKTAKAWHHVDERGPCIISGVGTLSAVLYMREWYKLGAIPKDFPEMQGEKHWAHLLVVTSEGLMRYEQAPYAIAHGRTQCAFGEGRDFALGAMAMGADAARAVMIAENFSPYCGHGVDTYVV